MFTDDFNTLQHVIDRRSPMTDREVRLLRQRDIYRTSLQFGDPFLFIHRDKDHYGRYRDLEFVHFGLGISDRVRYASDILTGFPDAKMLCHFNSQRFLSDYRIITFFRNHILVWPK